MRLLGIWCTLIAACTASSRALFNINVPELFLQPYYDVKFAHDPPEDASTREAIKIRPAGGPPFMCHLPSNVSIPPPKVPVTDPKLLNEAADLVAQASPDKQLLLQDLYWMYMFDRQEGSIVQFRPQYGSDGKLIMGSGEMTFNLGYMKQSSAHIDSDVRDNRVVLRSKLVDGDICDLTGRPRETDVYFFCDPKVEGASLVGLEETGICNYEAKVVLSTLCYIPEFRPPTIVTNHIVCSPVDGEITEELADYLFEHYLIDDDEYTALIPTPSASEQDPPVEEQLEIPEKHTSKESLYHSDAEEVLGEPESQHDEAKREAANIEAGHIEAGHIEAGHIEAGYIEADQIEADPIKGDKSESGNIEEDNIDVGNIDADHSETDNIEAGHDEL